MSSLIADNGFEDGNPLAMNILISFNLYLRFSRLISDFPHQYSLSSFPFGFLPSSNPPLTPTPFNQLQSLCLFQKPEETKEHIFSLSKAVRPYSPSLLSVFLAFKSLVSLDVSCHLGRHGDLPVVFSVALFTQPVEGGNLVPL